MAAISKLTRVTKRGMGRGGAHKAARPSRHGRRKAGLENVAEKRFTGCNCRSTAATTGIPVVLGRLGAIRRSPRGQASGPYRQGLVSTHAHRRGAFDDSAKPAHPDRRGSDRAIGPASPLPRYHSRVRQPGRQTPWPLPRGTASFDPPSPRSTAVPPSARARHMSRRKLKLPQKP